jgi:hypothetical protein
MPRPHSKGGQHEHPAQAEAVAAWLRTAMVDGMAPLIEPVPVEVEVTVASTWGGD